MDIWSELESDVHAPYYRWRLQRGTAGRASNGAIGVERQATHFSLEGGRMILS